MSDPTCFGSLQVCAMRVALLDTNGEPLVGVENGYVSGALVTVDVGLELSEGDDLEKKNGCGEVCQSYKDVDRIKRANLGLALCELDVQVASLLIGGDLFEQNGDVMGWQVPAIADTVPDGVCFEVWTKAWDGGSIATPASFGGNAVYWHWVFPKATFTLDDMTMEADFLEFALTGNGFENGSMWAAGPFNDWPTGIVAGGGVTNTVGIFLDDTLPTASCGFIEVPAQAS